MSDTRTFIDCNVPCETLRPPPPCLPGSTQNKVIHHATMWEVSPCTMRCRGSLRPVGCTRLTIPWGNQCGHQPDLMPSADRRAQGYVVSFMPIVIQNACIDVIGATSTTDMWQLSTGHARQDVSEFAAASHAEICFFWEDYLSLLLKTPCGRLG